MGTLLNEAPFISAQTCDVLCALTVTTANRLPTPPPVRYPLITALLTSPEPPAPEVPSRSPGEQRGRSEGGAPAGGRRLGGGLSSFRPGPGDSAVPNGLRCQPEPSMDTQNAAAADTPGQRTAPKGVPLGGIDQENQKERNNKSGTSDRIRFEPTDIPSDYFQGPGNPYTSYRGALGGVVEKTRPVRC